MSQATSADAPTSAQEIGDQGGGPAATEQVRERASEATDQVRGRVSSQIDQRSTQAGERLQSMASDAHTVGDELRKQGKEQPARLADQAADRVDRFGGYLQRSDGDRILHDLEGFGRRQPAAVVAGGLALGFLASRFLKASSAERHRSLGNGSGVAVHRGTGTRPSGFPPHA